VKEIKSRSVGPLVKGVRVTASLGTSNFRNSDSVCKVCEVQITWNGTRPSDVEL